MRVMSICCEVRNCVNELGNVKSESLNVRAPQIIAMAVTITKFYRIIPNGCLLTPATGIPLC